MARVTVRALKDMLETWPEEDADGEPTEVWIQTVRGVSDGVKEIWPLNRRTDDEGRVYSDILLTSVGEE